MTPGRALLAVAVVATLAVPASADAVAVDTAPPR